MTTLEKYIKYQNQNSIFLYQENILPLEKYQELIEFLDLQQFKAGNCISGKPIPRLQIWYHLQGSFFCEAWKYRYERWKAEAYHPILLEVQKTIEEKTHKMLDSILEKKTQDIESSLINQLNLEKNLVDFNETNVEKLLQMVDGNLNIQQIQNAIAEMRFKTGGNVDDIITKV